MGQTVLIVDDQASFRHLARALLEADGFEVIGEAADGAAAVHAVNALAPDVVLLDVRLPDRSGIDVAPGAPGDVQSTRRRADVDRRLRARRRRLRCRRVHPEGPAERSGPPSAPRSVVISRRRWTWVSTVAVAVIIAALAAGEQRRLDRPWTMVIPELVGGLALVGAGLAVRRGRATNRCWWLLAAAGIAWFVGDFEHVRDGDVAMAAFAFAGWQGWLLAWVVLAYPTGRIASRHDRSLVVVVGALFAARTLSRLFLHVPPDVAGYGTRNRFLPVTDDRWWRLVEDAFAWAYSAAIVLVLVSTAMRWVTSSRPVRRMLAPVLFAALRADRRSRLRVRRRVERCGPHV